METIQACVNPRLLTKADRLFTGTLDGRIIELLQNARRAGATEVTITSKDGWVTIKDNGSGIEDFARLLDLGGSDWGESCKEGEDPAGVGIFCLAPREVTIRSKGRMATISKGGWTHQPVEVLQDPDPVRKGTILQFQDEPWEQAKVDLNAVFCGMQVVVDGKKCPRLPFVSENASHHAELGCKIEVRESSQLDPWHHSCRRGGWAGLNVIVNFHGHVVVFYYYLIREPNLHCLVDLTGAPTGIRLMLPTGTHLAKNEAYQQLLAAVELEIYRYIERADEHPLRYKEYLRARELGITLPEAQPIFTVGLISNHEEPKPVEVVMPKDFPLHRCYRFDSRQAGRETDETNAHLLAALGQLSEPFIPVDIRSHYDGYSWANLPTISKVDVQIGNELFFGDVGLSTLACTDSLSITVHTSDGKVFSSPVCMAKAPPLLEETAGWAGGEVVVTPEARDRLRSSEIWYHLGGWDEEYGPYDTQFEAIEAELNRFWLGLVGPDEQLRQSIMAPLHCLTPEWKAVHVTPDGQVRVVHADGSVRAMQPPADVTAAP